MRAFTVLFSTQIKDAQSPRLLSYCHMLPSGRVCSLTALHLKAGHQDPEREAAMFEIQAYSSLAAGLKFTQ